MEHLAEEDVLRFFLGATSRQENRRIVRHLLSRCPACAEALKRVRPEPPVEPGAYDEALDRFVARLQDLAGEAKPPPPRASANLLSFL